MRNEALLLCCHETCIRGYLSLLMFPPVQRCIGRTLGIRRGPGSSPWRSPLCTQRSGIPLFTLTLYQATRDTLCQPQGLTALMLYALEWCRLPVEMQ